mgnify:CR=1 FL=1
MKKLGKKKFLLLLVVLLPPLFVFKKCTKFSEFERGDRIMFKFQHRTGSRVFGKFDDEKMWFIELRYVGGGAWWKRIEMLRENSKGRDTFSPQTNQIEWIKKHPEQIPMPALTD